MSIRIRWLGYVCFEIVLPSGRTIVTDPYIDFSPTAPIRSQDLTGADYVTITHGHFDHVTDVGTLVHKFNSRVVCSHQIANSLANAFHFDPTKIIEVAPGDKVVFDDLDIQVKRGQHVSLVQTIHSPQVRQVTGKETDSSISVSEQEKEISSHLAEQSRTAARELVESAGLVSGEQLNFAFRTRDNLRIYLFSSGPYDHLRYEIRKAHPNIVIAQLGGNDPEKIAEFVAFSGAEVVIPSHHDGSGKEARHAMAQAMAKQLAKKSKAHFEDIEPGKWYEVGVKISST